MKIAEFIIRHPVKIVLSFKFAVLLFILSEKGLYFGERDLSAQQQTIEDPSNSGVEPQQSDNEETDDGEVIANRRGYLDNLLNLPKINRDELKQSEISQFLNLLDRKEQQVQGRIKTLDSRERQLKIIEGSIDKKLTKLDEEMAFFQQTIQKEKEINQKRLDDLVAFYEKMTPKKAAPVFEQMDKDLVVALFNRFPKKQTMNILSQMNPEKSVELTEYFGRIRSGKEYELLKEINTSLKDEFQKCVQ